MKNLKRLALILATVMMFFTLTACQSTTPTVTNPETNTSTTSRGEVELVNQGGVRVILVGNLDLRGNILGPQIKIRVENNSSRSIMVQARNTSVNGFSMDAIMSCTVNSGEKGYDTLLFLNSDLENAGITSIKTIKTAFAIIDGNTWHTLSTTNSITISF